MVEAGGVHAVMSQFDRPGPPEAAALLAEREHLRALLRLMPVGVFIVDARGWPLESNSVVESIWGGPLPRVGLEDYGIYEGYWPGNSRRLEAHEWALARTLHDGHPVVNEEVEIVAFDGARRTVLHSTTALKNPQGTIVGAVAVKVDITPHRQAEHAEAFLSEATRLLVESLDWESTLRAVARLATRQLADYCIIDVVGEDGELHRLVAAAREPKHQSLMNEVLRFPPKVGSPSPLSRVFHEGRPLLLPDITPEMLGMTARSPEHLRTLEQLEPRACMAVPLSVGARRVGLLDFILATPGRSYTERELKYAEELARRVAFVVEHARLYREAEQAVEARDEFVAIATHELRTPLSALSLQLTALQRAVDAGRMPTGDKLRRSLVTARRQTERLEQLVKHLLDVSRISTGRMELELEDVDLAELVRWVVVRFEEQLAEAGCTTVVRADAPVVTKVDRLRVEQVVMNLLSNAMKYAPGQPVELHVERGERMAVLGVRDSGPGITPEAQARIFERYQRASGKHSRESLGLGLYVARRIARAHGGELKVESTPGQGAHFFLLLPLG